MDRVERDVSEEGLETTDPDQTPDLADEGAEVDGVDEVEATEGAGPAPVEQRTGHAAVDGVLASLEGIETTPVVEQVPVFESAHETLRAALADAGNSTDA